MPELPEVETTRRGIAPLITGRRIASVRVRDGRLRWPVPDGLDDLLRGQRVQAVERRAKYLLIRVAQGGNTGGKRHGTLIVHLGMSGSLTVVADDTAPGPHDHVDIVFEGERALRLRDPRRFGAILWAEDDPAQHALLRHLGPEPLDVTTQKPAAPYLHAAFHGRRLNVHAALLNSRLVAGVGNIYAAEALYAAGIDPRTPAGRLSAARCHKLERALARILARAIRAGGTTLRDFQAPDGKPGYFSQRLKVYGRGGLPCSRCGGMIRRLVIGQRSAFVCGACQRR